MLSNVGGVVAILFAILFHGHMEATDVGATASSMPLTGSHEGILKARWTIYSQLLTHRVGKRIMILVEQKNLVD